MDFGGGPKLAAGKRMQLDFEDGTNRQRNSSKDVKKFPLVSIVLLEGELGDLQIN